ncbi:MAG: Glu-tRNA(Gln) amidotransferase subunit GatE [Candidatus Thermoplasmatota archaeon]|nr:Glu-tRNA(Gln) amidotransferase subunit GatE [Candidatus Thermoplasmatota archaeon]
MEDKDFEAIGFKCGLEIHQQLRTERKLFCRCPPVYRNDPAHYTIVRHMRPTLSEMGTYDGTALMEFKTRKNVTYQFFRDTTCSYETDDTPPFELDPKALEISMVIARAMGCALVDEVHVSRKQYLDGSIPTGFQRTAIISLGGKVPWKGERDLLIRQISLEEDACREMSDVGHEIVFRTDRLSTPLVEVVTEPVARNPTEAGEMAEVLGWVMRSTGLVRRGPGATRQDVNVSVEGGVRVEIKGVPYLELIPPITAGEAVRQYNLLKIMKELNGRGLEPASLDTDGFTNMKAIEVTSFFEGRDVELFRPWFQGIVRAGGTYRVMAVLIPGFKGVYSHPTHGDQTFADELAGRVRVIACLDRMPNLLTSDDTPLRGVTSEDIEKIGTALHAGEKDAFVLVWGDAKDTDTALKEIFIRSKEAFFGVPNETRQVLNPHTTTFERILPGPDRMYPDTDRPPIVVTKAVLDNVNTLVPRPFWEEETEMVSAGVPSTVAHRLIVSDQIHAYREAVASGCGPRFCALALMERLTSLKRKGVPVSSLERKDLLGLFTLVRDGTLPNEMFPEAATLVVKEALSPEEAVKRLYPVAVDQKDLIKVVKKAAKKDPELVERFRKGHTGPFMGLLKKETGGKAAGRSLFDAASKVLS